MLTVGYCRVSTDKQAEEGYSIAGQTEKVRAYSALRDLGEVVIVEDPGLSGKDIRGRPGLQRVVEMAKAGHLSHVVVWRLDRLSRNLGDLIMLADCFGQHGVALHSVSENLDLSSATGRMFYNILGTFAQFYREQLAENVRMGMQQAIRQGRWINRPKTGYDLIDGLLVPNGDAPRVQEIFRLRAEGRSYREIEERTGVKYSTVCAILGSRIYVGEVLHRDQWYPGVHEAIVTEEEWAAAHRGHVQGRRRGSDLLTGRVRCGLCGQRMAIEFNGEGRTMYRCRHRGRGCGQPRRTTKGLHRAAVLGLRLVGHDQQLQEAIRRQLGGVGRGWRGGGASRRAPAGRTERRRAGMAELSERRRKLLELYYRDQISGELFAEEEAKINSDIELQRQESERREHESKEQDELLERFDQVAAILAEIDIDGLWKSATEQERRVLVEELVEEVAVLPDHLEVVVAGAPRLNVLYREVGLKESQIVGVGGGT